MKRPQSDEEKWEELVKVARRGGLRGRASRARINKSHTDAILWMDAQWRRKKQEQKKYRIIEIALAEGENTLNEMAKDGWYLVTLSGHSFHEWRVAVFSKEDSDGITEQER